jgi:hypothetical protein
MNFFPRGLTNFFKNVENIYTPSVKLQEITKDDLAQFGGKLILFGISYNEIRVIEGDLFVNNPNLEVTYLEGNKIVQIDSGAFDGLQQLYGLWVFSNPCTDDNARAPNREEVLKLIPVLLNSCNLCPMLPTTTQLLPALTMMTEVPTTPIPITEIPTTIATSKSKY